MSEPWQPGPANPHPQAPYPQPPPYPNPQPPAYPYPQPTPYPYGQPSPYPPGSAYPAPYPYPPAPAYRPVPSGTGLPRPVAVQPVAGAPGYAVAIVGVAPTTSGPAVASLVVGVGSILVSLVVLCFGGVGADGGWGPIVAGAFAVLAGLIGVAAVVLGRVGYRQIKRAVDWGATKGRGMAVTGIVLGAVGLVLTVLGLFGAFALTAQAGA